MNNEVNQSVDRSKRLFVRRVAARNQIASLLKISPTAPVAPVKAPAQPVKKIIQPVIEQQPTEIAVDTEPLIQIDLPESVIEKPAVVVEDVPASVVDASTGTSVDELPITSTYKKYLRNNDINTIEQLQSLISSGLDLVSLKDIGDKSASRILEGLDQWLSEQKKTQL